MIFDTDCCGSKQESSRFTSVLQTLQTRNDLSSAMQEARWVILTGVSSTLFEHQSAFVEGAVGIYPKLLDGQLFGESDLASTAILGQRQC